MSSSQTSRKLSPDQQLAVELAKFYDDPLGHVMFSYPWDTDESIQMVELAPEYRARFPGCRYGPDKWACEFLDEVGAEVKKRGFDGRKMTGAVRTPIQFATASGHGIGKSTLVAWLVKWILDTRPYSNGTVTANTAEQLKGKTWAEIGKWHRISATASWFEYVAGRGNMILYHKQHKENWKCGGQTCREENSEAFAGQHAANSTSFYIFDEASAVPDKIFEVREGGTTDGEPMCFDFGNPTRNSGRFFENCMGKFRSEYIVRSIDSRRVQITNKERLERWRQTYGEDSDFFRVRVKGEFPKSGSTQFISLADYEAAQQRPTPGIPNIRRALVRIGVDVARFGDDDSCIWPRVDDDARSFPPKVYSKLDGIQLANKVIEVAMNFLSLGFSRENIHIFVDTTGGYGASPYDHLTYLGWRPHAVNFGQRAKDGIHWFKSDQLWGKARESIRTRLVLPQFGSEMEQRIRGDLTQREYGLTTGANLIHLETKDDMKERGLVSPDVADALVCTFSEELAPVDAVTLPGAGRVLDDFDPYAEIAKNG